MSLVDQLKEALEEHGMDFDKMQKENDKMADLRKRVYAGFDTVQHGHSVINHAWLQLSAVIEKFIDKDNPKVGELMDKLAEVRSLMVATSLMDEKSEELAVPKSYMYIRAVDGDGGKIN